VKVLKLAIPDVVLIAPRIFSDERGYFLETWQAKTYADAGLDFQFVQENQSGSRGGTLRGLHYQIRHPQGKLVRVIRGEIFDVAVDLRRSSATFGQGVSVRLSADERTQIYVPPGFAHGFLVTSESADVVYKCTDYYFPEHERTVLWNDPDLGIAWPNVSSGTPLLSEKDRQGVRLRDAEVFA